MVTNGDFVAAGDARGKRSYVLESSGPIFDVPFEDPVLFFSVNSTGFLTAIVQVTGGYEVNVYNKKSSIVPVYSNVMHDPLVQPAAADVSADGRYIMIAMFDLRIRMTLRVSFYYVNRQDTWAAPEDGLFAWWDFTDEAPLCVRFMDDNNALLFTDRRINCYRPGEMNKCDEQWSVPLHNKIDRRAFYGGSRFAFAAGDRLLNDYDAAAPGAVYIYSVTGEKTGEFQLGRKASSVSMGHNAVLVGADRSFYALNASGGRIWEYIALQEARGMIFLDNTDTVLIAGGMDAQILKRERVKISAETVGEPA
jgi:hypothetical protein